MNEFGNPAANDMDLDFGVDEAQQREIESTETFKDYSVPEGKYLCRIISVEPKESKAGNKMLEWTFDGQEAAVDKKQFRFYTVLGSDNMTFFLKTMKYTRGLKPKDLIGRQAKLHLVKDAPYTKSDGSVTINSKIKSVLPATDSFTPQSYTSQPSNTPPMSDDDIPF